MSAIIGILSALRRNPVRLASDSAAQIKKDIRGFYPGMSREAFIQQAKATACGLTSCEIDQGTISFIFSDLPDKPLKKMVFTFKSGTEMAEMIALTANQYAVPMPPESKTKANIKAVMYGWPEYVALLGRRFTVHGTMLAKWDITKDLTLQLEVKKKLLRIRLPEAVACFIVERLASFESPKSLVDAVRTALR